MEKKVERKDFRAAVKFTEFKIRRQEARQAHENNLKSIRATLDDTIEDIRRDCKFRIKMEEAKAEHAIQMENERLNARLMEIAEEQADFERDLRDYVANLTQDERDAFKEMVS